MESPEVALLDELAVLLRDADPIETAGRGAQLAAALEAGRLHTADVVRRAAEIAAEPDDGSNASERVWAATAELLLAAGHPVAARECATRSAELVLAAMTVLPGDADTGPAQHRLLAARESAVRHGLGPQAVELLCLLAESAADRGRPWAEVAAMFAAGRAECAALAGSVPAGTLEPIAAMIGYTEGRVALRRWRPVEAEAALRPALPVLRAHGRADVAAVVDELLAGVDAWLRPGSEHAYRFLSELHEAAGPLASDDLRAVVWPAVSAVQEGGPVAVAAALAAVRRQLRAARALPPGPRHLLELLRDVLSVRVFQQLGLRRRASTELLRAEERVLATGAGLQAALIAVQRGLLIAGSDPAAGLRVLLPAVLALDAVRLGLDDANRRHRWSAGVRAGFEAGCRAAAALGDRRTLAELLEVGRATAMPVALPAGAPPALHELLDAGPGPPATDPTHPWAGPVARGGGAARTVVDRPARLRTPWRSIALAGPLDQARRYHEPVCSERIVSWIVNEELP